MKKTLVFAACAVALLNAFLLGILAEATLRKNSFVRQYLQGGWLAMNEAEMPLYYNFYKKTVDIIEPDGDVASYRYRYNLKNRTVTFITDTGSIAETFKVGFQPIMHVDYEDGEASDYIYIG